MLQTPKEATQAGQKAFTSHQLRVGAKCANSFVLRAWFDGYDRASYRARQPYRFNII